MALSRPKKKTYFSFASNGTGPAMRMSFGPQRATMAYKSHSKSGLEVLAKYAALPRVSASARRLAGPLAQLPGVGPMFNMPNFIPQRLRGEFVTTGAPMQKLPDNYSAISALRSPAVFAGPKATAPVSRPAIPAPVSPPVSSAPASGADRATDAIGALRQSAAARPGLSPKGVAKAVGLSGAAALAGGGAVAGASKLLEPPTAGGKLGRSVDSGLAAASNGINSIKNKISPTVNALRQFYGTPAGQMATGGAAALGAYGLARGMLSRPKDEEEAQRGYR